MRAMRVHELSEDIAVLRMEDVELPPPGPGEVRLRLKACSINFPDILMIQGKLRTVLQQDQAFPFTEEAWRQMMELSNSGRTKGKLVMKVAD